MKQSLTTALILFMLTACSKREYYLNDSNPIASVSVSNEATAYQHADIILFGSSSVTPAKWQNVQTIFSGHNVLQMGFGGATLGHLYNYTDSAVTAHSPDTVFLWCGDNDIKGTRERGSTFFAADLLYTWKRTFTKIRTQNPGANIVAIEIKNSPATNQLLEADGRTRTIDSSNALIKKFLASQSNTGYVKINDKLLPSYYQSDSFHLTPLAYTNVINPAVLGYLRGRDSIGVPPVEPPPPPPVTNKLPIVRPGDPITIHLNQGINRVTLDGTKSLDPDGRIVRYDWLKIRGPKADMFPFATGKTYAAHLVKGDYLFQLKVTDNKGATNAATRSVYVK